MTQEYTPVAWQDETTSQQGTLINAERLNQMQTAHHYADGLEEVDAIPTADPGVSYHKIVYCTADSTIYRWDGTEWTKDIDDETKALLQQEIARATAAEGELAQDLADEATARETADTAMQADISALQSDKLDKKTTGLSQTQVYGVKHNTQKMLTLGQASGDIPMYSLDSVLYSKMPTLYDPINDTVINYGWATAQIGAEATARADADTALGGRIDTEQARAEAAEQANAQAIANTYTKAEIDTALGAKADQATTYTKSETDALLALKADVATTYTKTETDTLLGAKANDSAVVKLTGDQTIQGVKTFYSTAFTHLDIQSSRASGNLGGIYYKNGSGVVKEQINGTAEGNLNLYPDSTQGGAVKVIGQRAYNASNTDDVATIGTLDAYTPMVRTTGNQTIAGDKEFTGEVKAFAPYIVPSYRVPSTSSSTRINWYKVFSFKYQPYVFYEVDIYGQHNNASIEIAKAYFTVRSTTEMAGGFIYNKKNNNGRVIRAILTTDGTTTDLWLLEAQYITFGAYLNRSMYYTLPIKLTDITVPTTAITSTDPSTETGVTASVELRIIDDAII